MHTLVFSLRISLTLPILHTVLLFLGLISLLLAAIVEKVEVWPGGRKSSALEFSQTKKERGGEILCRVITLSGAEAVGAQDRTGSLEVGKRANFIAVDRDLSKGHFSGAVVLKTWFEGQLVYDCKDYGSGAKVSTTKADCAECRNLLKSG